MIRNPFFKFIVTFAILVIIWFSFYENIYDLFESDIQRLISIQLANHSTFFIKTLGYTPILDTTTDFVVTSVEGNYFNHGVWIGEPCNGLKVFGLFSIFIIAFKGKWIHKIWYILLGILILHITNAIRIAILTIISAEQPTLLDFNHNITFQVLVYSLVFGLWYFWVNKLSKK